MSSAAISTSAAQGRFFVFDAESLPEVCLPFTGNAREPVDAQQTFPPVRIAQSTNDYQKSKVLSSVTPASHLAVRPAPETVSSGIAEIDVLTGGLPRGCLTEIFGPPSSGRTTLLLASLVAATRRGEFCALVDGSDAFDPQSAAAAGVDFDRLLWIRCGGNSPQRLRVTDKKKTSFEHRLEQLLRATDLLLESGGFGMIVLDLCDLPPEISRRIPMATWFRFRRTVESTPTVLLAFERQSSAGSCSTLQMKLRAMGNQSQRREKAEASGIPLPTHAQLLTELGVTAEIVRSRIERKPVCPAEIKLAGKTAWAG
jgi:recA bacterial DNA recombination protein